MSPANRRPGVGAEPGSLELAYVEILEYPRVTAHAIQILSMASALVALGHRVSIWLRSLTPTRPDAAALEAWLGESFGLAPGPGLALHPLVWSHKGLAGLDLRLRLLARLWGAGPGTLFLGRNRRQTLRLLAARRLARRRVPAIVYELHNLEHELAREEGRFREARRIRAEEERLVRQVDGIAAISRPLAEDLQGALAPACPVEVLPDGVDLERFRGIARSPLSRERVELVYAGGLFPHKGVDCLLHALAHLPERVRLSVVGGNPPEDLERLKALAGELFGDAPRVRFEGQVPPAEVPRHLARADLLLLPAGPQVRSQRYTSPLKLFEAMATGAPIVAAPSPALTSLLEDGRNAVVARSCGAQDLAAAVLRALEEPERALDMARTAMREVEGFSWEERARRLVAWCRSLGVGPP